MKYKYLLFDVDNTLLDFSASEKIAICEVFNKYNISLEYIDLFSKINDFCWKEYEKNTITREKLRILRFELMLNKINRNELVPKNLDADYFEKMSNISINIDGSIELLKACYNLGHIICAISNASSYTQNKRINANEISKYITKLYISEEIGYKKPDKDFFDYVINDTGANRSECLIIGDSLTSDITGGINAGIDTCWYNPNGNKTNDIVPTYTINELNDLLFIV